MNLLKPELFKLVGLMEVRHRKRIWGQKILGENFRGKGRGMEFRDVRKYNMGDDVRFIDWNVTSRTGEVHTKEFYQERDLPVYIILDSSSSLTRFTKKVDTAFQLCIFISLLHKKAGNRIQFLVYSEDWEYISDSVFSMEEFWKQGKRIESILSDSDKKIKKTNHKIVLQKIESMAKQRSVVYWISDFANFPELNNLESTVFTRNDMNGVCIFDPWEDIVPTKLKSFFFQKTTEENNLFLSGHSTLHQDREKIRNYFYNRIYYFNPGENLSDQIIKKFSGGL